MGRKSHFVVTCMVCLAVGLGGLQSANGFTMATFADPTVDGTTPLFQLDQTANSFTGGWSGNNLTLETPGFAAPDVANAQFTMTPLAAALLVQQGNVSFWSLAGGTIQFLDSLNQLVLQIDFGSAVLSVPFGFGASDFALQNVAFSGPQVPAGLTDEVFGFSFANPIYTATTISVTAGFTSSAVPEPISILLLTMGLPLLLIRRRR